jgi:hypothetical protein
MSPTVTKVVGDGVRVFSCGLNQQITAAGMLESATSSTGLGRLRASHKYSLCWCAGQRQGWSCQCRDGTQCQDWGVLDSEADRPKVIFLAEKIRRALAKLNPEERMLFSCLKAIPSWTGSSGSGTW